MMKESEFNPFIPLPAVESWNGRQEFVLQKCQNKRVLHLGCVDTGLTTARFQKSELMHQKLAAITTDLWGFDINAEGIHFLQTHGFDQLVVGDVCMLDQVETLQNKEFDVILATEVVEHLQNPGLFLQAVQSVMQPGKTELIITVPNAYRVSSIWWMLRNVEHVHPDHNYWFSYHTITTLIQKNRLSISDVFMYTFPSNQFSWKRARKRIAAPPTPTSSDSSQAPQARPGWRLSYWFSQFKMIPYWLFASWLLRKTPFFGDGLIVVCTSPIE